MDVFIPPPNNLMTFIKNPKTYLGSASTHIAVIAQYQRAYSYGVRFVAFHTRIFYYCGNTLYFGSFNYFWNTPFSKTSIWEINYGLKGIVPKEGAIRRNVCTKGWGTTRLGWGGAAHLRHGCLTILFFFNVLQIYKVVLFVVYVAP